MSHGGPHPVVTVNAVVDEKFATTMNAKSVNDLLGKVYYGPGADGIEQFRVIGVVANQIADVTGKDLQKVFVVGQRSGPALIRIAKTDIAGGLAAIDEVVKQLAPGKSIERRFADEQFEASFSMFNGVMYVLSALAVLAFAISIMGIAGMVMHTISRRTHEIGIHKVLGARSASVFVLLLRDFSQPIVVATLVAWPLAYVFCSAYLSLFTYRISLTFWPFVVGLVTTVLIAWGSVSVQAIRAARLEPAKVLRYE